MKNKFYSYIDGFNKITVIIPKRLRHSQEKKFTLFNGIEHVDLQISGYEVIGEERKYSLVLHESLDLTKDYTVYDEQGDTSFLRIGSVVRTDLFDMMYSYEGNDLGLTYEKNQSTFRIWTPVAKEVEVELVSKEGVSRYVDASYVIQGLWQVTIEGDLEGFKYRYRVRINESFEDCLDPYGIASDANAQFNYVVDSAKFYAFKHPKPEFSGRKVDAIIYEFHVRDLTIDPSSGVKERGHYLGLIENSVTQNDHVTGLNYMESLGITHAQIMPVYDFGGVDEENKDAHYNWGYNPVQFNVPEGWYSTNPHDPYARINELRQMVDAFHEKGIRLIMDVVYNHVYEMHVFPWEKLVPGYFYRFDQRGMKTEVSGCGNDVASERKMTRKFILDSVKHWMTTYNMSGFRFDLMGLLDIETMNNVEALSRSIDPQAIVYGEGWNMPNTLSPELRSHMHNHSRMPNIGHFNDKFRETIKGGNFEEKPGYAMGAHVPMHELIYLFTGSCLDGFLFFNPNQTINYVECHDNHTFYDRMKLVSPNKTEDQIQDAARLALAFTVLSQGVPFIHAGQEFFRSKQGVENAYRSPDDINKIDWNQRDLHMETVWMLRDLISIRKSYKEFRHNSAARIKEYIKYTGQVSVDGSHTFTIKGIDKTFLLVFKNDYKPEMLTFSQPATVLFDGLKRLDETINEFKLIKPGAYIFIK